MKRVSMCIRSKSRRRGRPNLRESSQSCYKRTSYGALRDLGDRNRLRLARSCPKVRSSPRGVRVVRMTQRGKPVAVVIGVGPGLGAALVRRFAAAYPVAMLARNADYLKSLAGEVRQSGAAVLDLRCDVGYPA